MPLTSSEAENLAKARVQQIGEKSAIDLTVLENETIEFKYGWVFFYQSLEFVNTGNPSSLVGGNAPILIDKYNSSVHILGTGKDEDFYIEKYCLFRDNPEAFKREIL